MSSKANPLAISLSNARLLAEWLTPWLATVRLPFLAFILGAAAHDSSWWLLAGLCFVSLPFRTLLIPFGLVMYFRSSHIWFASFLTGLSLSAYIAIRSDFLHVKSQVDALLHDLLGPESLYFVEELEVIPDVLKEFPSYSRKQWAMKYLTPRAGFVPASQAVRLFRFRPSVSGKATGAATAFAIGLYSSLIFVRGTLEELKDAQRFQLYHELGHGTTEGVKMFTRGLRWQALQRFNIPMHLVMILLCGIATDGLSRWFSIGLLLVAYQCRSIGANSTIRSSSAASEVLADSFALTHSEFLKEGKWKERAENLAKRLEDESTLLKRTDPRAFMVFMRAIYLRKWLELGEVGAVLPADIDPRLHLAFPLYVLAGFYAHLTGAYAAIVFWIIFVTALLAALQLPLYIMRMNVLVGNLDEALKRKLKMNEQQNVQSRADA